MELKLALMRQRVHKKVLKPPATKKTLAQLLPAASLS